MTVDRMPRKRPRVYGRGPPYTDAFDLMPRGPGDSGPCADERREGRGVGDRVEEMLDAEVRSCRVDADPEVLSHRPVVGTPLGAGHDAGHPDTVICEVGQLDGACGSERMAGSHEEIHGLVVHAQMGEGARQTARVADAAERGVDGSVEEGVEG